MSSPQPPPDPAVGRAAAGDDDASALRALANRIDAQQVALPDPDVSGVLRRAADELDRARRRADAATESALRWKERAVGSWADSSRGTIGDRAELVNLRDHAHLLAVELDAVRQTFSWRVTAPLRTVRRLRPGRSR